MYTVINHTTPQQESMGDTLSLVNQADIGTRNFSTTDATKTYTLSSALGETKAGNFTISGNVSGTNISTVDLNGNAGFNLTNATNLTLSDVKLTGASGDAVTLNNSNAKLNVSTNSIINGNVTNTLGAVDNNGTITGNVTNAGDVDNTSTFNNNGTIGGNLNNSGAFTSLANKISGSIANTGNLNLTGGELGTAITGSGDTKINGDVTVGNTGSIANAVSFEGTGKQLTAALSQLTGGITVNDGNTLNLQGQIANGIAGTGTVKINEQQDITSNITYAGTLNINSNTLNMNDSSYETLTVGKLNNNGNLTLDVNANTDSADHIAITNSGSNSVLTITALNLTAPTDTATGVDTYTYTEQILTGTTSGASLVLGSGAVDPAYNVVDKPIDRSGTDTLTTNQIKWNDSYGGWIQNGLQNNRVEIVGNDTIQYSINKTWGPKTYTTDLENLAIMNTYTGTGSDDRSVDFTGILSDPTAQGNYTVISDLGTATTGKMTVKGERIGENTAKIDFNGHSGFGLNDNTELVLKDAEIKGASSLVSGTASTGVKVVLDGVNIHDNGTGIQTGGDVEIKGNSTIGDKIQVTGTDSKIDVDGSNTVTLNSKLMGTGTSKLNISNGTVNVGSNTNIAGMDVVLNNTALNLANENILNGINTTFNGTNNMNLANNNINTLALGNINLNGVLRMQIDADLANSRMDQLTATSATIGAGGRIEVSKINLMSPTTQTQLELLFTDNANLAGIVNYTGEGQIVYSPIYKYNTSYVQKGDGKGYFTFATAGSSYNDFNPSVMASSVATIVTGYQNQMQALHQGFYHMDRYMKHSDYYRFAAENQNKIASLAPVTDFEIKTVPETSQAMWVIPYSTFESINLRGGVKVNNIAYGMTYGGDSDMFDMGHGFKGVVSGFVGYNGNHMTYDGISMTQNGGFLGATLNAYRDNFFTGVTISTGASSGDADTMYGHDNVTLLTAGIASKTGYNFEFWNGRIILQPSLFLGYSWVNTFDYTNSAGVKIKQDALNALQIAPGFKIIGNTKNGWQPYAGIDMIWNIFMGRNQTTANDVILPKLSEKAYVQYGVGIQKTWADRFTGFLQAMIRNGGRNGIVLSTGFRWTFGKKNKKAKNKTSKPQQKTVIKKK